MKTIIFSNIVGDVFGANEKPSFLSEMEKIITSWNISDYELVYIDAPMDGYDNIVVFKNILKCFEKVNISFRKITFIGTTKEIFLNSKKPATKKLYFLTGGNPLTQLEIIKNEKLSDEILSAEYCIGFCAGGMNLSKHGILTSDDDFKEPLTYNALARVEISIEPHFNYKTQKLLEPENYAKRLNELNSFVNTINSPIYAIPDTSFIYFNEEQTKLFGDIMIFDKK